MAILYGPVKFRGRLKGLRTYKLTGSDEIVVASSGSVSKGIRKNNRAYARQHNTNFEFTARTKLAKDIRNALGEWTQPIVHRYLHGHLSAKLNDIQLLDKESNYGYRNVYLSRYKDLLYQVVYYYYKPLSDIMQCPYTVVDEGDRKKVTVILRGLHPFKQIKPPVKATHFQICLSIGCVKDYTYDAEWNLYKSYTYKGGWNSCETTYPWIPIDGGLMDDITLTVSLPADCVLADDETVVRTFGIVFGRMTAEVVPLQKDRGSIVFLGAV